MNKKYNELNERVDKLEQSMAVLMEIFENKISTKNELEETNKRVDIIGEILFELFLSNILTEINKSNKSKNTKTQKEEKENKNGAKK